MKGTAQGTRFFHYAQ